MRHKYLLTYTDRVTVLLTVYSAFSAAVIGGIWAQVPLMTLGVLLVLCGVLLGLVILSTRLVARVAGLPVPDRPLADALRIAQEPGQRRAHGARAVSFGRDWRDHAASHDFPPVATDGLRVHRASPGRRA